MEYRGYTGTVEHDAGQGIFHGQVEGLRDTITYEADSLERLEAAFRESIDHYIDACRGCEEVPEPPPRASADDPPRRTQRGPGDDRSRPAESITPRLPSTCPVSAGASRGPRG
jgi:hypothetical protein